jgi:hypothetical protein
MNLKHIQFAGGILLLALIRTGLSRNVATLHSTQTHSVTQCIQNLTLEEIESGLTPLQGSTPAQWRIIWRGDAAHRATISWTTAAESTTNTLYYDTRDHGTNTASYHHHIQCQLNGKYETRLGFTKSAFYHHAVLTGLKPNINYYFVMTSDNKASRRLWFKTAPDRGTAFSLLHGGDSRSRHLNRCRMNILVANLAKKDPAILAFVHGGDYVMNGNSWNNWSSWLSHYELTTGGNGRVLPIIPVRGNHDDGPIFNQIFNIRDWYTTNLGRDVAIVSFNSDEVTTRGDSPKNTNQLPNRNIRWLDSKLATLRPKTKWLLANYHIPLYPAVKSIPDQTAILAPIFEKHNINLGCECDGHTIKRTVPIRNGKKDPTGIIYIGEGGMGVTQRTPKKDRWYLALADSGNHVMKLSFAPKKLTITTILMNSKVFDTFTLSRH